jgi:succinyl-CoA synthetase beta subunit
MKLHEYQAKELLRRHGVPVPPGQAAHTVDDAAKAAEALGGNFWVVKAQVHAGGRGKGRFKEVVDAATLELVLAGAADVPGKGGVQLCRSIDDVRNAAAMMLGNTLVTKQTGAGGVVVKTVLVTTGADIARELYAALLLDRQKSQILLMASTEGGTEIEEVAAVLRAVRVDETLLVLPGAASARALEEAVDAFQPTSPTRTVLTKLDESEGLGALVGAVRRSACPAAWFTDGQEVPDDIERADAAEFARRILGCEAADGGTA